MLPISASDSTKTKAYIDSGLNGKVNTNDLANNYMLKSKHLTAAKTYRVVVYNQYQTVIIIGFVNGGHSFYTFMANASDDTNNYIMVYGTNKFTITKVNNTTFDLTVGGSSDCYLLADYVSIT